MRFREENCNILSMEEINKRIKSEVCYTTIDELKDEKLMTEYKKCSSFKKKINEFENIIDNTFSKNLNEETQQKLINAHVKQDLIDAHILQLIPPGAKGAIRGNKFNDIIKKFIEGLELDASRFEIKFEKKCDEHDTNEIPDWYISEKTTGKKIIGMNQVDLWRGGAQSNRGFKYIDNNKDNTECCKLLCVVCNEKQFKTKTKTYKLFEIGFKNDTLCYLNNLKNIITSYFKIETG